MPKCTPPFTLNGALSAFQCIPDRDWQKGRRNWCGCVFTPYSVNRLLHIPALLKQYLRARADLWGH